MRACLGRKVMSLVLDIVVHHSKVCYNGDTKYLWIQYPQGGNEGPFVNKEVIISALRLRRWVTS